MIFFTLTIELIVNKTSIHSTNLTIDKKIYNFQTNMFLTKIFNITTRYKGFKDTFKVSQVSRYLSTSQINNTNEKAGFIYLN